MTRMHCPIPYTQQLSHDTCVHGRLAFQPRTASVNRTSLCSSTVRYEQARGWQQEPYIGRWTLHVLTLLVAVVSRGMNERLNRDCSVMT